MDGEQTSKCQEEAEMVKQTPIVWRCRPAKSEFHTGLRGLKLDDVRPGTVATSSTLDYDGPPARPLVPPIYHSSTYSMEDCDAFGNTLKSGYVYTRLGCPTTRAVEATICDLEGGEGCIVLSSGMAAITSTLMTVLRPGDHMIACNPVYSGTHKLFVKYLPAFNITVSYVNVNSTMDAYRQLVQPNTKVIYAETPCNPTMAITDLQKLGELGQSLDNVITVVDGTFATPYLQQPLKYGIDVSIHSCTKYLGGHSDLLAGCLTVRSLNLYHAIRDYTETFGAIQSAFDSSLLHRGLKTLHVRMERHCSNALHLASFLERHPKVKSVYYSGLQSHPDHELAKKQMKAFGGMISFIMVGGYDAAKILVESVRLIHLAASLGGVESLIEHVCSMTHGKWILSEEDKKEAGLDEGLTRISVGLEDVVDLEKDLAQAMENIP